MKTNLSTFYLLFLIVLSTSTFGQENMSRFSDYSLGINVQDFEHQRIYEAVFNQEKIKLNRVNYRKPKRRERLQFRQLTIKKLDLISFYSNQKYLNNSIDLGSIEFSKINEQKEEILFQSKAKDSQIHELLIYFQNIYEAKNPTKIEYNVINTRSEAKSTRYILQFYPITY